MMFNILLLISTVWAQSESQYTSVDPWETPTRYEQTERLNICEDNQGRRLFTRANLALGLGVGLLLGGTTLFWEGGIVFGALATLAGIGVVLYYPIVLPVSTHMLIKEVQQNDIDLFLSESSLYFVDVLLVSGLGSLGTDHPEVSILIPAAYIVHEIQGVRMLKALNIARELEC